MGKFIGCIFIAAIAMACPPLALILLLGLGWFNL